MSLIITIVEVEYNSQRFAENTVLEVPDAVASWFTTIDASRIIVAGPIDWTATIIDADTLVKYLGQYWVNNAEAAATDLPGSAIEWIAVTYLPPAGNTGGGGGGGSGGVSGSGNNFKFENGNFYVKDPVTGSWYIPGASINVDGQPVPIVQ